MMMTAKKKSKERKKTPFPREIIYTTNFVNAWEKIEKSGKHDMHLIKEAISLLMMNDGPLPAEWKDHKLNGNMQDFRECHVKGDLLMVYQIRQKSYCDLLICAKVGTHSEIF